jgi:hypothetical protein
VIEKKYKAYNRNQFNVGIKLENPYREQNIKYGSFAMLTMDEIAYIHTNSTLFSRGMLQVDDKEVLDMLGISVENFNVITDEEIVKILKSSLSEMKRRLKNITEMYIKNRIYSIVKNMGGELSVSKVKFLIDFIGRDLFLEEIK